MTKYLLTAILASASLAFGQSEMRQGPGPSQMLPQKLDPEQREQIMKLREEFQPQAIDLRADLQKLRLTLRQHIRKDKPNMRTINSTVDQIAAKRGALEKLRVNQHVKVRALLTPDQRRSFDARPFTQGNDRAKGRHFQGRKRGWNR